MCISRKWGFLPSTYIHPLPNEKFLDMTELKAIFCDRVENTVGKEENAVFSQGLLL